MPTEKQGYVPLNDNCNPCLTSQLQDTAGDLKGDGMQLGATFIIEKGGKVLLEHRQKFYGDYLSRNAIRKVLGLPINEDDEDDM